MPKNKLKKEEKQMHLMLKRLEKVLLMHYKKALMMN
jgi:hypothetical protein